MNAILATKPVILVVEDEEDSRDTLQELLELEGYRAETAVNGQDALDKLNALGGERCVMLLDLFMPVMDGWQVVEQLRSDGRLVGTKIIITSSATHKAPVGIPVIEKPVDFEDLLREIEALS